MVEPIYNTTDTRGFRPWWLKSKSLPFINNHLITKKIFLRVVIISYRERSPEYILD